MTWRCTLYLIYEIANAWRFIKFYLILLLEYFITRMFLFALGFSICVDLFAIANVLGLCRA